MSNQKVNLDDIHHLENNTRTYYKERYIKENDLEQKLIVTYSPLYQRYQSSIREKQIERVILKKYLDHSKIIFFLKRRLVFHKSSGNHKLNDWKYDNSNTKCRKQKDTA